MTTRPALRSVCQAVLSVGQALRSVGQALPDNSTRDDRRSLAYCIV